LRSGGDHSDPGLAAAITSLQLKFGGGGEGGGEDGGGGQLT